MDRFKASVTAPPLVLAYLAVFGPLGNAGATQLVGDLLEVYGNLYPEHNLTRYSDSVATGTPASNLTRAKTGSPTTTFAAGAPDKSTTNWAQSYIGIKGQQAFDDLILAYDFQRVVVTTGSSGRGYFTTTRDGFVSLAHPRFGTLLLGQADTIYKEFGDRVRMLGVSSANFVSTSSVLSGVGWKSVTKEMSTTTSSINPTTGAVTTTTLTTGAAGSASFNTRIGDQIRWISPNWKGVELGLTYHPDLDKTPTRNRSLTSVGLRWSNAKYYVALSTEQHNDYRTFSGTDATPSTSTIVNKNPRSRDYATRLSLGYKDGPLKLGADLARLTYTEAAVNAGKFTGYTTTTWQASCEYKLAPSWTVGSNYASGAAGKCTVLGDGPCSTTGLGGTLFSLGVRWDFSKNVGLFALYGKNTSNESATFASSAIGGTVTNTALGLRVDF